jgi:hypothetical protein
MLIEVHSGMVHLLFDHPTIVLERIKDFPHNTSVVSENVRDLEKQHAPPHDLPLNYFKRQLKFPRHVQLYAWCFMRTLLPARSSPTQ